MLQSASQYFFVTLRKALAMNTKDKKAEVLELLTQTNDSGLIDEVYDVLHPESSVQNINMEELTGELQQKVSKALDDYKTGNYITHDQMKQKLQQWLTK
jgi:predicted transcriptional regulator